MLVPGSGLASPAPTALGDDRSIGTSRDLSGFVQVADPDRILPLLAPSDLCSLFNVPQEQHQSVLEAQKKKPHPEVP